MKTAIPKEVEQVLNLLWESGFEAYPVGGCVRDSLRGVSPKDWDVTTSALPGEVVEAMRGLRVIETGLQHGTVTVIPEHLPIEVTTYRVDGTYSDHRRPDSVTFTRSLSEDLKRRDFTINALALQKEGGVIDLFHGREDLKRGIIRCVGDPACRFEEDALRIMRALRFASELSFSIHPATAAALWEKRGLLCTVASERLTGELIRLLCGKGAGETVASFGGVLGAFLPELEGRNAQEWRETGRLVDDILPEPPLRLAALLYGLKGEPGPTLRRLRLDKKTEQTARQLCTLAGETPPHTRPEVKWRLNRLGVALLSRLLRFQLALAKGTQGEEPVRAALATLEEVLEQNECWSIEGLAVKGLDLLEAGVAGPGRELGECLQRLLGLVVEGDCPNEREALLAAARG